jgi:transposase-like protein
LLIRFLSNSIEAFFNDSSTYTIAIPFQNKPQVCINRLCDYYSNSIITTYKKTYYPTYVQGTFKCPHCGLTYGRKWIWANNGKNGFGQKSFLIDQGELWQEKVMQLYANGMSIRDIQNSIGTYKEIIAEFLRNKLGEVEYSRRFNPKNNTLYKHIEKGRKGFYDESLKEINMGEQEVAATFSFEKKRLFIRRRNIYNLVQGNPALSRKGIEELARTDYRWLMKNNKEWLNDILPPTKRDK